MRDLHGRGLMGLLPFGTIARDPQPDAAQVQDLRIGGCWSLHRISQIIDAVVGAHAAATLTVASTELAARHGGWTGWARSMIQRRSAMTVARGALVARSLRSPHFPRNIYTFDGP